MRADDQAGEHEVIVRVFEDKISLSATAAEQAATAVRRAFLDRGRAVLSWQRELSSWIFWMR
jgi:hypothetical protein